MTRARKKQTKPSSSEELTARRRFMIHRLAVSVAEIGTGELTPKTMAALEMVALKWPAKTADEASQRCEEWHELIAEALAQADAFDHSMSVNNPKG